MIGQIISHYKIVEKLGEGGMGVVYKGEDLRLNRTVALKFLPHKQGVSDEDRERFRREAQAAAALDHPNICTVYEIDETDDHTFLAMAFLEGRTLDKRIADGPLELKEALEIARQSAEGLEAAHGKGIVHRDVKPANLMLIEGSGGRTQVKILDFGLAQLAEGSKLTKVDSLLGTIAYMSPEQTQGQKVDRRADIWALGATLYEMVAGEPPFKGHYEQATMYSILNEDPEPLTAKRSRVPMEIEWAVEKCLAKDPAERYQSAQELAVDLATIQKKLSSQQLSIHRTQVKPLPDGAPLQQKKDERRRITPTALALGAAALAVLGIALGWALAPREEQAQAPPQPLRRFEISAERALPAGVRIERAAISPDGARIAFTVTSEDGQIWLRDLDRTSFRRLEETAGVRIISWSPDSRSIAFATQREVRRVPVEGGDAATLCSIPGQFIAGLSWDPDGSKVYFTSGPPPQVFQVSAAGGQAQAVEGLAPPAGAPRGADPPPPPGAQPPMEGLGPPPGAERTRGRDTPTELQFLENSRGERMLLYTGRGRLSRGSQQITLRNLSGEDRTAIAQGAGPFWSPEGYVLYQPNRETAEVWAVPVSLDEARVTGEPVRVADGLFPSASADGALVTVADSLADAYRLTWRGRDGAVGGMAGREQARMTAPRISPDGRFIAVDSPEDGQRNIWLHESDREIRSRLTDGQETDFNPVWSADGKRFVYTRQSEQGLGLWVRNADGSGDGELIHSPGGWVQALDWSRDAKTILVELRRPGPGRNAGVDALRLGDDGEWRAEPFLEGDFQVGEAAFSPDGDWVAYDSNESGEFQVHVRQFPSGGGRRQISTDGGRHPHWNPQGGELFYVEDETLVSVAIDTGGGQLQIGRPEQLFSTPALRGGPRPGGYAVDPSGDRFLLIEPAGEPRPPTIRVTLNWTAALPGASGQ